MKKRFKAIVGLLIGLVIFIGAFSFFIREQNLNAKEERATASIVGEMSQAIGNTKNKFVVLEIVPNLSLANFGYMALGQEPIDVTKACDEGNYAEQIQQFVPSGYDLIQEINTKTYKQYKQKYGNDTMDTYWKKVSPEDEDEDEDNSNITYKLKSENAFAYNNDSLLPGLQDAISEDDTIVVVTLTSKQLNYASKSELNDLLAKVNLFYAVQTKQFSSDIQKELFDAYGKAKEEEYKQNFLASDISWDVAEAIFTKIADKDSPTPIMMDSSIYYDALNDSTAKTVTTYQYKLNRKAKYETPFYRTNVLKVHTEYVAKENQKASNNNMYKLYLMTMFRDQAEFYNLFIKSEMIQNGSYALQSGTYAKEYWNTYTFLPCQGEKEEGEAEQLKGDETFWKDQMGIITNPNSQKVIVQGCAYSFDASKPIPSFLENNLYTSSNTSFLTEVFEKTKASNLSHLEIMKYIINYKFKKSITKATYKVLEVEPSNSFSLHPADIERLFPYTGYYDPTKQGDLKLKITTMTSAQFIGNIEDLNAAYDMIYIGDDIGAMNTKEVTVSGEKKQVTDYGSYSNNSSMQGVIYAHVGGEVALYEQQWSYNGGANYWYRQGYAIANNTYPGSSSGQTGFRYSGNDITNLKKEALETFISSGFPVIVAGALVDDAASSSPKCFNDLANNNMYKFVRQNKDRLLPLNLDYRALSSEEADEKLSVLTKNKPVLKLTDFPLDYVEGDSSTVKTFSSTSEARPITYTFTLNDQDNPGAYYNAILYVDKNADGIFKPSEKVYTRKVRANGASQTITFQLNTNYSGAFTWKLEVQKEGNPSLRTSQVGYSCIRVSGEKQSIKVLQVYASGSQSDYMTSWGWDYHKTLDLSTDSTFQSLFNSLADYNITIKTMALGPEGTSGTFAYKCKNSSSDILDGYDMLIFGFADSYRDKDLTSTAAKVIQQFIDDGKSVLFTHDLTSQINSSSLYNWGGAHTGSFMETTTGYNFNRYLRDSMGFNRFKQSYRVGTTWASSAYDKTSTSEYQAFTYTALLQYSNFVVLPGSGKSQRGPYKYLEVGFNDGSNRPWPDVTRGYETTRATNANNGQITRYPYQIPSTLNITKTHGQYYQLNMEDEDIVVWYCLSDTEDGEGEYSASPNDVSNNYYIYNKGNVTYSGVGHRSVNHTTEAKLFVNTIVAALRAGVIGPQAVITNGDYVTDADKDSYHIYTDIDSEADDDNNDDFKGNEEVEFYVTDDSPKATDTLYVALELVTEDASGNVTYKNVINEKTSSGDIKFKIKDSSGNTLSKTTFTNRSGNSVNVVPVKRSDEDSNKIYGYTIEYPKEMLKGVASSSFRIVVYNAKQARGFSDGMIIRNPLFDLD